MKLTGDQMEELTIALTRAFDLDSMEQMLRFKLEKNLSDIVLNGGEITRFFKVIQRAEEQGWTDDLIDAAHKKNPASPELTAFVAAYRRDSKHDGGDALTDAGDQQNDAAPRILHLLVDRTDPIEDFKGIMPVKSDTPSLRPVVVFVLGSINDHHLSLLERIRAYDFPRSWWPLKESKSIAPRGVHWPNHSSDLAVLKNRIRGTLQMKRRKTSDKDLIAHLQSAKTPLVLDSTISHRRWTVNTEPLLKSFCQFWCSLRTQHHPLCMIFSIVWPKATEKRAVETRKTITNAIERTIQECKSVEQDAAIIKLMMPTVIDTDIGEWAANIVHAEYQDIDFIELENKCVQRIFESGSEDQKRMRDVLDPIDEVLNEIWHGS